MHGSKLGAEGERRSAAGTIAGITVAVADPERVEERWRSVVGELPGVEFVADPSERGIVAIHVERDGERLTVTP